MPQTFTLPKQVVIDPLTGNPAPGAKAYFYETTTSTPLAVYSDSALTTAITQPVVADSAGVLQVIYLGVANDYKLTLTRADDSLLYTVDPLESLTGQTIISTAIQYIRTPAEISASVVPLSYWVDTTDYYNIRRYFNGTMDDGADISTALNSAIAVAKGVRIPPGNFTANTALTAFNEPISIVGSGRAKTVITTTLAAGNWLEFNNAAGSYDEGLLLSDFALIGPGSGSAVGLKIEGAVYVNSVLQNILVKSMGSHGIYADDCLTMLMSGVRAQTCGGIGILVDQSNGITLAYCSAESNVSHGIYLNDGGAAFGENFGATLIACHSEANSQNAVGHAVYIKNHYAVNILGGWFQTESTAGAYASAGIMLDGAQSCKIVRPVISTGGTVTNLIGLGLTDSLFNDAEIYCYGFAANRDVVGNAASNRNKITGIGGASQGAIGRTDASTLGNTYENYCGSGGNYGHETIANLHSMFVGSNEMLRVDSAGLRLLNHTSTTSASAGAATALPATPEGYVTVNINGTARKVAYY